jgi:hypothetical protein
LEIYQCVDAEILELADLLLQPRVSILEVRDTAAGRAGEGDVAVVVSHVENRRPEIIGLVFQLDVVPERLIGDLLDSLVFQEPHEPGEDARH